MGAQPLPIQLGLRSCRSYLWWYSWHWLLAFSGSICIGKTLLETKRLSKTAETKSVLLSWGIFQGSKLSSQSAELSAKLPGTPLHTWGYVYRHLFMTQDTLSNICFAWINWATFIDLYICPILMKESILIYSREI